MTKDHEIAERDSLHLQALQHKLHELRDIARDLADARAEVDRLKADHKAKQQEINDGIEPQYPLLPEAVNAGNEEQS